tara:strand:- start:106 stop:726 length:621 start_codon:yes stop_codon:yes gene_type:complete
MTFFIWTQFALVCLLGAMSPGPSLALIINNSINYNRLSGILASVAHGLGIFLYATITVISLEFILQNHQKIFFIIQILGSIFLFFLGLLFIFKKNNEKYEKNNEKKINAGSFVQGFVIAIINPKILVWFVAIYSQFITVNANFSEKLILIITPSYVDAIWYSLIAILVTSYGLKDFFNNKKNTIQKIIGALFIIIAASLIYSLVNF